MAIEILIGADPELFYYDPAAKQFRGAEGIIPGTKVEPFKVPKGAIQVDGMAAEFNIDPARSREEFIENIRAVREALASYKPEYKLLSVPTAKFDPEYFDAQPAHSKELGCNPDWNAYTGRQNDAPLDRHAIRTGAGHIHIGWTTDADPFDPVHMEDCTAIIKQLDYYVGAPSLLWDRDKDRRKMYGAAGAFRPKSYGVEYRTPSNAWLGKGEALAGWVYERSKAAVLDLINGEPSKYSQHNTSARQLINSGTTNHHLIREYLASWGVEIPGEEIFSKKAA